MEIQAHAMPPKPRREHWNKASLSARNHRCGLTAEPDLPAIHAALYRGSEALLPILPTLGNLCKSRLQL